MKPLPCPDHLWPRFSALLDTVLELDDAAREAWLVALPAEQSELRPWLAAVLRSGADGVGDDYLDRPRMAATGGEFSAGQRLGPWRLLRPLGSGGMGAVWLAQRADGAYERELALKLPHAHLIGGALRARFDRERDILAGLVHPHIARFYDAGLAEQGQPWLALEFVEGVPLTAYCEQRSLGLRERIDLIRQVCSAVQAAHARLIVHRDLKPANVLVTADGQVKLLDFGIAKLLGDEDEAATLTIASARVATPDYAAPEQMAGGAITVATDVYALGVLLFELLTDAKPFARGRTRSERDGSVIEAPLASSRVDRSRRRELAGDLDAILAKAMEPEPLRRYASVEALATDLALHLAHQPIRARHIDRWQRAGKFVRRNRRALIVAGLLLATLAAGTGGVLWQAHRAEEQARRAGAIKNFLVDVFKANDTRIATDAPRGSLTVKALLDAAAPKIEAQFASDPELQIELLRTVADIYGQLGDDERYDALQALQLRKAREHFGPLHRNLLEGAVEAAARACSRGQKQRCSQTLADADALLTAAHADDSALRAAWWTNEGLRLQVEGGRGDDARRAFERSIELFGEHDPVSRGHVTALHELAGFLTAEQQQHGPAIALYRQAAALAESLPERNDAELQTLYGNLGLVYQQLGQFSDAAAVFQKSADIADRTTGAQFPTAWVPRANAARTLHLAGQRVAAHREFDKLLPLLPPGGDSLEAITVRQNYGERLASEGRAEQAIPYLEAAERVYRERSTFSFQLRLVRRYLGDAYARAGRADAAEAMLKASLDDYLAQQGDREQPVMVIRERWGRWLLDAGRPVEAQPHFEAILAAAEGRKFAHVALAYGDLARIALDRGDLATARAESASALSMWEQITGFRDVRMQPYLQRIRADVLAAGGDVPGAQRLEDAAAAASAEYDDPQSETRLRRVMVAR